MYDTEPRLLGFIPDTLKGAAAILGLSAIAGAGFACNDSERNHLPSAEAALAAANIPRVLTEKAVVDCISFQVNLQRNQRADLQRHVVPLLDDEKPGYSQGFKRHPFGNYRIFIQNKSPENSRKLKAKLTFKRGDTHVRKAIYLDNAHDTYSSVDNRTVISIERASSNKALDVQADACEE